MNSRDLSSSPLAWMKSSRVSRTAPPPAYRAIVNFAHLLHTVVKMNGGLGRGELWYRNHHLPTSLLEPSLLLLASPNLPRKLHRLEKGVMKMQRQVGAGWKSGQFSGSIRCLGGADCLSEQSANLVLPRNLCWDQESPIPKQSIRKR